MIAFSGMCLMNKFYFSLLYYRTTLHSSNQLLPESKLLGTPAETGSSLITETHGRERYILIHTWKMMNGLAESATE